MNTNYLEQDFDISEAKNDKNLICNVRKIQYHYNFTNYDFTQYL